MQFVAVNPGSTVLHSTAQLESAHILVISRYSCAHPELFYLFMHASPLQESLYLIWVHFQSSGPERKALDMLTINKYLLSLSSATRASEISLLLLRSSIVPMRRDFRSTCYITYSGHAELYNYFHRLQRVLLVADLNMIVTINDTYMIKLPGYGRNSACSGAATHFTDKSISRLTLLPFGMLVFMSEPALDTVDVTAVSNMIYCDISTEFLLQGCL